MKEHLLRLGVCIGVFGFCLYSYLDAQNEMTHLKIRLPELEKEIRSIREESQRLSYRIDQFEDPSHLIELAHNPEFSHLRHPLLKEVLTVPEAFAVNDL